MEKYVDDFIDFIDNGKDIDLVSVISDIDYEFGKRAWYSMRDRVDNKDKFDIFTNLYKVKDSTDRHEHNIGVSDIYYNKIRSDFSTLTSVYSTSLMPGGEMKHLTPLDCLSRNFYISCASSQDMYIIDVMSREESKLDYYTIMNHIELMACMTYRYNGKYSPNDYPEFYLAMIYCGSNILRNHVVWRSHPTYRYVSHKNRSPEMLQIREKINKFLDDKKDMYPKSKEGLTTLERLRVIENTIRLSHKNPPIIALRNYYSEKTTVLPNVIKYILKFCSRKVLLKYGTDDGVAAKLGISKSHNLLHYYTMRNYSCVFGIIIGQGNITATKKYIHKLKHKISSGYTLDPEPVLRQMGYYSKRHHYLCKLIIMLLEADILKYLLLDTTDRYLGCRDVVNHIRQLLEHVNPDISLDQ